MRRSGNHHGIWRPALALCAAAVITVPVWLAAAVPGGQDTSNTLVRFEILRGSTNLGRVDVELFDYEKPQTVRNFLLYLQSGAYSNSFLHRCVPGFVVQGGGFAVTNPAGTARFTNFLEITNYGRLTNEFLVGARLTNLFGTLAMAKVGGDPDSATSQWFFNLGNNSTNLDTQNGGFTVFGRVLESTNLDEGTNVLAHFNTLSSSAGIVNLGNLIGSAYRVFSDLPVSFTTTVFRVPANNELYYVNISLLNRTNQPGTQPPTITLLSPEPNARFTNQVVSIRGTASDDTGVARVIYRVDGGATEVAVGTTNWQINLSPQPGFRTVTAESIDCDGGRSTNSVSVTFFYVAQRMLDLQVAGTGTVSGATNGMLLQAGRFYTFIARPGRSYVFDGWSGAVTSSSPALTFQVPADSTNFTLMARFKPDPLVALAGSYHGLIRPTTTPALDDTAFITLAMARGGRFSGSIRHRGGRYAYTGRFDRDGNAFVQGTVGGVSRSLSLRLNLTNDSGAVTGSLLGGSGTGEVQIDRLASKLSTTNPPPAGRYTLAMPPRATTGPRQLVPGGHGFAIAKLGRSGALHVSGMLGDGRTFTSAGRFSRSRRWPLYTAIAGGQGVLAGWLSAAEDDARNFDGNLHWIQAPNSRSVRYPLGFTNQVACVASFYAPPVNGTRVLNWVHGLSRVTGANLELGVTNLVKLSSANYLAVTDPSPMAPTFTLQMASGSLKGSFVHPWTGTTNVLRGVILQRDDSVRGQFTDEDQTGSLLVGVAPFLVTQSVASVSLEGLTQALGEGGLLRFEQDGVITLTEPLRPQFDTALDASGHNVTISGNGVTRLFEVPAGVRFLASGITFANGRHHGTNGTNAQGDEPASSGEDACGAGIFNAGGIVALTNCTLTNFVVVGGDAGMWMSSFPLPSAASGGRGMGAAICSLGGTVTLQGCLLADSAAEGGGSNSNTFGGPITTSRGVALGGALFVSGGDCEVRETAFLRNRVRGGEAWSPVPAVLKSAEGAGGALALDGARLRVVSSMFSNNVARGGGTAFTLAAGGGGHGGALFVETNAEATVERTLFTGNSAEGGRGPLPGSARARGGAVFNGGTLRLRECALESNVALGTFGSTRGSGFGGAVASVGMFEVSACMLNDNQAEGHGAGGEGFGGALHAGGGSMAVTNSTFAFNLALGGSASEPTGARGDGYGGALFCISNSSVLVNLTVVSNTAVRGFGGDTNSGMALGGGIANTNATVSLRNSILAGNAPADLLGPVLDLGYNLVSDESLAATGTGSRTNVNPLLGPLTTNGGPTRTFALLPDSPARDVVPLSVMPAVDQRGFARPSGAIGDIGAFEAAYIPPPPVFVVTPSGGTVRVGANFTFRATATGEEPIHYFWLKEGELIPGATNSTLFLPNVQATNAGIYAAIATNISGAGTSAVATLTVDARPLILSQPADISVAPGGTASFGITVDGPQLSFAWSHDGPPVLDGTNSVLVISNAAPGAQGGYQVIVTNYAGAVTSRVALLTFNSLALSILTPPRNTVALEGQSVTLSVLVSGIPPFAYQWLFENVLLPGATNNTLSFASVHPTNSGAYRVVVTNDYASITSPSVFLTVITNMPLSLLRGPYLQSGSHNGAVVRWRTDHISDAIVRYGLDATNLDNIAAEATVTNEHIVQLTGLAPDTRYFYSVGSSGQQVAGGTNAGGEDFWFRTAPLPGTRKPTRIWVLGDSGTAGNSSSNAQVITRTAYEIFAATNGPADLWLMLGDNAYNNGTDAEYQRAVFDIYPATLRNLFLWPALGNHETSQSFTAADFPYLHVFSLPRNAEAGGLPSGSERYYSFDYANIHFICLDSMTSGRTTNSAMAQWLVSDLAATTQEWVIAYFHHPPYTKGSHDSDIETELIQIRENLLPILEANGVDLVLSGHSHSYERSFFLNGHYGFSGSLVPGMKVDGGDGRLDGDGAYRKNGGIGTSYVVGGHSGLVSGGTLDHPAHFLSLNELGSLVIDVVSNRLDVIMLGTNAAIRDHFTIVKDEPVPLAIGIPPTLTISADADNVHITCHGTAGRAVLLQTTDTLGDKVSWNDTAGGTLPETGVVSWSLPRARNGGRFFRVVSR